MCGILAVLCSSTPTKLNTILKASELLKARGPDSKKAIVKPSGIYIFHRLAINDTSSKGNQPFTAGRNEEVILMCNGQIYNSEDLKRRYEITCESKSDCEVILHLYLKIGFQATVEQLDGVFAIVLVDKDTMYIARDRIGVRPLFIGKLVPEQYIAVASTPDVLSEFCEQIQPIRPNTIMSITKNNASGNWTPTVWIAPRIQFPTLDDVHLGIPEPIEACAEKLKHLLTLAVRKRLMSDRKVACFLSGGLDSSLVVQMMVNEIVSRGGKASDVRTYSIGMIGSTDLYYAKRVASHLGTTHTEIIFTEEQGCAVIPDVIKALGSYDITTIRASVGMYLLSKHISEKEDDIVILSGEGSDELLQGYLYFHKAPSVGEAQAESIRLMSELHLYDVLRADRCVSSHGLEIRVPFLDKDVVDFVMSLPPEYKRPKDGIEKWLLRKAFETKGIEKWLLNSVFKLEDTVEKKVLDKPKELTIPSDVLWRQKTAFSDGVSSVRRSWFQCIQEWVDKRIPDEIVSPRFPTKEAFYYFLVFKKYYQTYDTSTPYWLPKWCGDNADPSARTLSVCSEKDISPEEQKQ